ncbi:Peptidase C13 family [Polaromonas sp. CF318]|uniref:C13 family peptidase n=1 Tax=Polaromonas sp. CF318 TaxID=1144318 RepID=UPI0002713D80|nr:C13 family peptidase [Polaromonas sp. CF318]EJL79083.1 Peptidase C13 family [Polaromonas sp. CF318]
MTDTSLSPGPDTAINPAVQPEEAAAPATRLPLWRWCVEGLRAGIFLKPRVDGRTPTPLQALMLTALVVAAEVALLRLEIAGPARLDVQAWLSAWWTAGLFIGLAWWAFPSAGAAQPGGEEPRRPAGVGAAFVLWVLASLPNTLVYQCLIGAISHGWLAGAVFSQAWLYWAFYTVFTAWSLGAAIVLVLRFTGLTARAAVFAVALVAATGLGTWQFDARAWQQDYERDAVADSRPRLQLSQQTFEEQQALWEKTMAAIAHERSGVTDVYALVFAPYAAEDVFLRESTMVSRVLAERFDAEGRVVQLVNHATTAQTHPWATAFNMERAIDAIAQRMDRNNDLLVVYMTSHGASDFKLAAAHWPLEVPPVSPDELREALDRAGVRHRVIAISACYSGGWADALAGDTTLVMTAADATHTSYGCGRRSELTFFGRALFDEQLRKTHSFEQAFARAVPLIKQREIDAGKEDGFSNPQIRVGADIAPVLRALEKRLDALPPVAAAPVAAAGAARP